MKKVLTFLTFFLMLGGVASAAVYQCKFEFGTATITIDQSSEQALFALEHKNGRIYPNNPKLLVSPGGFVSSMIFIPNENSRIPLRKGSYDGYIYQSSKPGDDFYLKSFFVDQRWGYTDLIKIVITMWEKDLPAYFSLDSEPNKVFAGNCR